MRIVLDSNIYIAAFATQGLCHALFENCLVNHDIYISEAILEEVSQRLQSKIKLTSAAVREIATFLRLQTNLIKSIAPIASTSRDRKDDHVLALALQAHVQCIVTGDNDLLVLKNIQHIPILSPRQFWDVLRQEEGS